jgi:hypothetical protein
MLIREDVLQKARQIIKDHVAIFIEQICKYGNIDLEYVNNLLDKQPVNIRRRVFYFLNVIERELLSLEEYRESKLSSYEERLIDLFAINIVLYFADDRMEQVVNALVRKKQGETK